MISGKQIKNIEKFDITFYMDAENRIEFNGADITEFIINDHGLCFVEVKNGNFIFIKEYKELLVTKKRDEEDGDQTV